MGASTIVPGRYSAIQAQLATQDQAGKLEALAQSTGTQVWTLRMIGNCQAYGVEASVSVEAFPDSQLQAVQMAVTAIAATAKAP